MSSSGYSLDWDGSPATTPSGLKLSLRRAGATYDQNGLFYITILRIEFPKDMVGSEMRPISIICGGHQVDYPAHRLCTADNGAHYIEIPLDARWEKDYVKVFFT